MIKNANYKNIALKNRQKKYLQTGKTEAERYSDLRAETTEKICKHFHVLLIGEYNVSYSEMDEINAIVDGYAMRYQNMLINHSKTFADNWISEIAEEAIDFDYMLPAVPCPKTRKQWDELAVKRDAGRLAVHSYAIAVKRVLGYDKRSIRLMLKDFDAMYRMG